VTFVILRVTIFKCVWHKQSTINFGINYVFTHATSWSEQFCLATTKTRIKIKIRPENNPNNVAYYKKKKSYETSLPKTEVNNNNGEWKTVKSKEKIDNKKVGVELTLKRTTEVSELVSTLVLASALPSENTSPRSHRSPIQHLTSIEPAFSIGICNQYSSGSRVTVKVTHFNKQKNADYVSLDDPKNHIYQALGLKH
jgi:hypothetical protein